ncbi:MAG: Chromate reductase [Owenweeksia sp. TMED14]|nr:MAG: Chromate reductase [Owenweeksia sp. TMED14]|tara:strand:+ start:5358 stop:5891 length:534 start_codon:yes stop_codon:yes gene_type:complete
MRIIAFGASYSSGSINREWARYVSSQISETQLEVLNLNDYDLPVYTVEREKKGIPPAVNSFISKLKSADLLVISFAEYNGSYTAGFKNLFDWASVHTLKMFEGKKLILLSTAPGPRGGKTVLSAAIDRFPQHGADIIGTMSLPRFNQNFDPTKGILDVELKKDFEKLLKNVKQKINE